MNNDGTLLHCLHVDPRSRLWTSEVRTRTAITSRERTTDQRRTALIAALRQNRLTAAVSLAHDDSDSKKTIVPAPGTLFAWQAECVLEHIYAHFDSIVRTNDLATLARLSPFHFCRVFRSTFGTPPHRYVMKVRIECAQWLMLQTTSSLSQIAADCGLADQAHFTKLFRRFVGETPGAWRRQASR